MIRQISVRNLGCFDDQEYNIDFSEETLIAGPNNSGKSMFLAAMNFLRFFVFTGKYDWNTSYYSLRDFEAAVHNHDTSRKISISVTLEEDKKI